MTAMFTAASLREKHKRETWTWSHLQVWEDTVLLVSKRSSVDGEVLQAHLDRDDTVSNSGTHTHSQHWTNTVMVAGQKDCGEFHVLKKESTFVKLCVLLCVCVEAEDLCDLVLEEQHHVLRARAQNRVQV